MFLWLPHANEHILWGIACHRYLFKILQQKKKKSGEHNNGKLSPALIRY